LSDELGKWKAFNIEDNTIHDCKSKTNGNGNESKEAKKEITVEMVLKKLESIGIIINVDRLMNGQWQTSEIKNNFESKCSIKIETNSKGHNTTVHVYQGVTFQEIDDTIEKDPDNDVTSHLFIFLCA